jgi:carbamoyltransferase
MLILGITDSHDASVTLAEDGKVLFAASEERFTRNKMQQGFPFKSLEYAQNFIQNRRIDKVYVAGRYGRAIFRIFNNVYSRTLSRKDILSFSSKLACWLENTIARTPGIRNIDLMFSLWAIKRQLKSMRINYRLIEFNEHHQGHIQTAISGINSDCFLAVSLDAYGDGKSGLVVKIKNGKIIKQIEIPNKSSLAHFYGYICAALGFKEGEEGKVMALADYGKETRLGNNFASLFEVNAGNLKVDNVYRKKTFLRQLNDYRREDVAYALQEAVENTALKFISNLLSAGEKPDLFLSGGFFSNIKVNQLLVESGLFNRVFVFPNMGDGGLSFIAKELESIYLGPEYSDEYIKEMLKAKKLVYSEEAEIEKEIAILLAQGKVIARFNSRMEFGPRALGNRSILYRTDDPTVNDWLNIKLRRTEFMPFAPVTLFELKEKCYKNIRGAEFATKFMTVSLQCTDEMKKTSKGVIHIDGTARPQILKEADNPSYYKILKEYYRITGIPSLLNTSLNMHNEPIVCSPEDAVVVFQKAGLDFLAIGNFLLKRDCSK